MSEPKQPTARGKAKNDSAFEDRVLLGFVAAATIAMAWVSWPFFGAILWALVVTIAFAPVHDRLALMMPKRRNTVSLLTLLLVIALVIIPSILVGTMMVDEALTTYNSLQTREIDIGKILRDLEAAIPASWRAQLDRIGPSEIEELQKRLSSFLTSGLQLIAREAVSIGQGAFSFVLTLGVMLYLTFFLLRDGRYLTRRIGEVVPLRSEQRGALFSKFTTVIRATVKGSVIVALVQGVLGGVLFAFLDIRAALLWGVVMGLLALIPAVGTGLVWFPVGVYLLATGSVWQGALVLLFGFFVISMVDNVLRPMLVGQDTRMPDYIVLISTLGGLSVLGINGLIVGPVIAAMFIAAWEILGKAALRNASNVQLTSDAIIVSVRPHGEVGAIVRALTASQGLMAGYVQGARGRTLRPVLIPGNIVKGEWRARTLGQLASLSVDLAHSRAHLLGEPLAVAGIEWACTLTATTLPEGQAYASLHSALDGLLQAIELAPAARGWAPSMARYEALLLSELGYGGNDPVGMDGTDSALKVMAANRTALLAHVLGDRRADIMAARERLVDRLKRAVA